MAIPYQANKLIPPSQPTMEPEPDRWAADLKAQQPQPTQRSNVPYQAPTRNIKELMSGRWIPNATPQLDKAAGTNPTYWSDPRRIARYYHAIQALPDEAFIPEWVDAKGIESAYNYLKETRSGPWETWNNVTDDDPLNIVLKDMPVPPPNFMPLWEQEMLKRRYEASKEKQEPKEGEYIADPAAREMSGSNMMLEEQYKNLPLWKKGAQVLTPVIQYGFAGMGGAFMGMRFGLGGAAVGAVGMMGGTYIAGQIQKKQERGEEITEQEKNFLKNFALFDWAEIQAEKAGGLGLQTFASLFSPEKYGDLMELFGSKENFQAAYNAGAILYESMFSAVENKPVGWEGDVGKQVKLEQALWKDGFWKNLLTPDTEEFNRVMQEQYGMTPEEAAKNFSMFPGNPSADTRPKEEGKVIVGAIITSNEDIVTRLPDGTDATPYMIKIARDKILKGESANDVYLELSEKFGYWGGMRDLAGSLLLDPLDQVAPAINKMLSTTGKVLGKPTLTEAFINTHKAPLENTRYYGQLVRSKTPADAAQYSAFSRWVAGIDAAGNVKSMTQLQGNPFNYLFGLTPKAKANHILTTFVDGVYNLIAPETNKEVFTKMIRAISTLKVGDAIIGADGPTMKIMVGGELTDVKVPSWYLSAEAQMLPVALKDAVTSMNEIVDTYDLAEGQRQIIRTISEYMGSTPEDFISTLHKMKPNEAEKMYSQFLDTLNDLKTKGDQAAGKLLDTLTKAEDTKKLTGTQLQKMTDTFFGDNGVPFNEAILKFRIMEALETQISKWAVDYFGVKPDKSLLRLADVTKKAQSLLLLGLNPSYFFNNAINNIVTMQWDGILHLGYEFKRQEYMRDFGVIPVRYLQGAGAAEYGQIGAGTLSAFDIKGKPVGIEIHKASQTKSGTIKQVSDLIGKADKIQVFAMLSQAVEKWSSQRAVSNAIAEYMNRAHRVGKGISKMPDSTRTMLENFKPGLAKQVEKMIERNISKAKIEKTIWGEGGPGTSIRDFLDPEAADMLDKFGILKEFDETLTKSTTKDEIYQSFQGVKDKLQTEINNQVIRNMDKIVQDTSVKAGIEGPQGVLDIYDNLTQMRVDFWIRHFDFMERVAEIASSKKGVDRSLIWYNGKMEAGRNWTGFQNIEGAKILGMLTGLGLDRTKPLYSEAFTLIADNQINWNTFFTEQQKLWAAFQAESSAIEWNDPARTRLWNKLNEDISDIYLDASLKEHQTQSRIDQIFFDLYEKQFTGRGVEAKKWRNAVDIQRKRMVQAQMLWRTGKVPETLLSWGDLLGPEIKDAMFKISGGNPIHTFNRATRDKMNPIFYKEIYTRLVKDMSMASNQNAPGMPEVKVETAPVEGQTAPTTPQQGAGIPVFITQKMRNDLTELGYMDADIKQMRPEDAWEIINSGTRRVEPEGLSPEEAHLQSIMGEYEGTAPEKPTIEDMEAGIARADKLIETSRAALEGRIPPEETNLFGEQQTETPAPKKQVFNESEQEIWKVVNESKPDLNPIDEAGKIIPDARLNLIKYILKHSVSAKKKMTVGADGKWTLRWKDVTPDDLRQAIAMEQQAIDAQPVMFGEEAPTIETQPMTDEEISQVNFITDEPITPAPKITAEQQSQIDAQRNYDRAVQLKEDLEYQKNHLQSLLPEIKIGKEAAERALVEHLEAIGQSDRFDYVRRVWEGIANDYARNHPGTTPADWYETYFVGTGGDASDAAGLTQLSYNQELISTAIDYFGTTQNINEAGFIMPDGTLLDLSGRSQASGYQKVGTRYMSKRGPDYLSNHRVVDHREVNQFMIDTVDDSPTATLNQFMAQTGAVRIDANAKFIDISGRITREQIDIIKTYFDEYSLVEITDPKTGNRIEHFEPNNRSEFIRALDKANEYFKKTARQQEFDELYQYATGNAKDQNPIYIDARMEDYARMLLRQNDKVILSAIFLAPTRDEKINIFAALNKQDPVRAKQIYDQAMQNKSFYLWQEDTSNNWYHYQSENVINTKMPDNMKANSLIALLKNNIKPEELETLGIIDWLKGLDKPATKQEVLDYIRANMLEIEETIKGDRPTYISWLKNNYPDGWQYADQRKLKEIYDKQYPNQLNDQPKFMKYMLPGGSKPGNLLIRLPEIKAESKMTWKKISNDSYMLPSLEKYRQEEIGKWAWHWNENNEVISASFDSMTYKDEAFQTLDAEYKTYAVENKNYKSSHWDEKNILAHARYQEYIDTDGKRVLLIEEIQSDWHQQGREKGYRQPVDESKVTVKFIEPQPGSDPNIYPGYWESFYDGEFLGRHNGQLKENAALDQAIFVANSKMRDAMLDAPFKTTWPDLVIKRMIRWAAENGYDRVAWTPGEIQAARYNLSKQIDRLVWSYKEGDANGVLYGYKDGSQIIRQEIKEQQLPDYIGKEAAKKILEKEPDWDGPNTYGYNRKIISGEEELSVGGAGMRVFYDEKIPNKVKKYIKQWGSELGETTIPTETVTKRVYQIITDDTYQNVPQRDWDIVAEFEFEDEAQGYMQTHKEPLHVITVDNTTQTLQKVQSFDVTPEMRDAVMTQGQSLFQQKRGSTRWTDDGLAIMHLFETADVSTIVHETVHVYTPQMSQAHSNLVRTWLKNEYKMDLPEDWHLDPINHKDASEKLAKGLERYLAEGKAPIPSLTEVFVAFKKWMLEIYKKISGSDIDINLDANVRKVFDEWMAGDKLDELIATGTKPPMDWAEYIKLKNTMNEERLYIQAGTINGVKVSPEYMDVLKRNYEKHKAIVDELDKIYDKPTGQAALKPEAETPVTRLPDPTPPENMFTGRPRQEGFFDATGEDLPLLSGTAQRAQAETFTPQEIAPQDSLFNMRDQLQTIGDKGFEQAWTGEGNRRMPAPEGVTVTRDYRYKVPTEVIGDYTYFRREDGSLWRSTNKSPKDIDTGEPGGARFVANSEDVIPTLDKLRNTQNTPLFGEQPIETSTQPDIIRTGGIDATQTEGTTTGTGQPGTGVQPGRIDSGRTRDASGKLVIARAGRTAVADTTLVPGNVSQQLAPHQIEGTAKAIQALSNADYNKRGFILADGTGAGKTRQELAIAKTYADQGRPVVIVTKAEVIKADWKKETFSGSFRNDADAMGVDVKLSPRGESTLQPGQVYLTTYERMGGFEYANGLKDAIFIFDEAHAMKNSSSVRATTGIGLANEAYGAVYASATPGDKPEHLDYMMRANIFEGKTKEQAYRDLGLTERTIKVGKGRNQKEITIWVVNSAIGSEEVYNRVGKLFDRMTEQGQMIKREISMDGIPVQFQKIPIDAEGKAILQKIEDAFSRNGEVNGLNKANVLMHQRRQQEPMKIPIVKNLVKQELDAGRQVVVFLSRVNDSDVIKRTKLWAKGYGGERELVDIIEEIIHTSEGTVKTLKTELEAMGIKDIAELHGGTKVKAPVSMDQFQSGDARVMLATLESGGTGINLDDITGNAPRTIIFMTAPFSAVENIQGAGRVWRMTTKSQPKIVYLFGDTPTDQWNAAIIAEKMKMLGATVEGEVRKLDIPEDMDADLYLASAEKKYGNEPKDPATYRNEMEGLASSRSFVISQKFNVDDVLILNNPNAGFDMEVIYRGPAGPGKDMVFDKKSGAQFAVNNEWLRKPSAGNLYQEGAPKDVKTFALDSNQNRYEFEYKVVSLNDLITSHTDAFGENPKYPQELQPRLRGRAAGQEQVLGIAAELNPDGLLVDYHTTDRGAPIVGNDLVVESGNGRTMALRKAKAMYPDKYKAYQDAVRTAAQEYGLSVEGIEDPVLVRERITEVDRPKFTEDANVESSAGMSGIENAKKDAKYITDELLADFNVAEKQTVEQALRKIENQELVRSFLDQLPKSEKGKLVDAKGALSIDGAARIKYAMILKIYPDESGMRLLTAFAESLDEGTTNLQKALYNTLGEMAMLEGAAKTGKIPADLSIAEDVSKAVDVYTRLRQENLNVEDYLGQQSLFEKELDDFQSEMLRFIYNNRRSPNKLRQMISGYIQSAMEQPPAGQESMFGTRPTKGEILDAVTKNLGQETEFGRTTAVEEVATPPAADQVVDSTAEPIRTEPTRPQPEEPVARPEPIEETEQPAVGAPFGTADQVLPPPYDEMLYEGWLKDIMPTLDDAQNKMMNADIPSKESLGSQLTKDQQKELRKYLGQVYSDMTNTKMAAIQYSMGKRDFALHDYTKRTGADGILGGFFPYQFWYTRSALNWFARIATNPGILADYYRIMSFGQQSEDREGYPTRLKGKIGIPVPFLPDWMGKNIYVDPFKQIYPFRQMTDSFRRMQEETNMLNKRTAGVIQQQIEDGSITDAQASEAIKTKKGEVWEKAMREAKSSMTLEFDNPLSYATALASPSLPISLAINMSPLGDKNKISQLPITRTIQAITSMLGIGGARGLNIEAPFRKGFGLEEVDQFEDYRVNRELSNMVADGLLDPQTAIREMIDQKGPNYEAAKVRVAKQMNPRAFFSSVGLDFFPEGEQEMRSIATEYSRALEAYYDNGQKDALTKFWDEFPEYEARIASNNTTDPEKLLRTFLRSRVWEQFNKLNSYEKQNVIESFGQTFELSFLNKDTRNYDDITTETIASWAKTLGSEIPEELETATEIPGAKLPEEAATILNTYLQERDSKFPGISETLNKLYSLDVDSQAMMRKNTPIIDEYQNWRNKFIANNPAVAEYLTGEQSELYGLPSQIQVAVYQYRDQVNDYFPNIYDTQSAYFDIATSSKKKAFLNNHPELTAYWDYRREYAAAYPQAAPYILSDESLAKYILGEDRSPQTQQVTIPTEQDLDPALLRLLASYYYGQRELSSGARAELNRLWMNAGSPAGSMENWLNAYVWPTLK